MIPASVPANALVLNEEEWAALRRWLGDDDDGWLQRIDDLPDSLDAAWAEAEASLRKGWQIESLERDSDPNVPVGFWLARAIGMAGAARITGHGQTPEDALRDLQRRARG
jgi:hypothetical protein